jgi:hypothetical protein
MERITIDNKNIDLTPAAQHDVRLLLAQYLGKPETQPLNLEQCFREAMVLHRDQPRKFGAAFREVLIKAKSEAETNSLLHYGVVLNTLLDRLAYPTQKPTDPAIEGWPKDKYLPDGFSFLSYGSDIDRSHTDVKGEKIRIDKLELIKGLPEKEFQALAAKIMALIKTLPQDAQGKRLINSLDTVKSLYQIISDFIQTIFKASGRTEAPQPMAGSHSVLLTEFVKSPQHSVCRHRELLAQVLLQLFGLPGEVLECHMYINDNLRGNHLATQLKAGNGSYIVDFTNPDRDKTAFVEKMEDGVDPETDVNQILWRGDRNLGPGTKPMGVTYLTKQTTTKVHYRILHGWD